MNIIPFIFIGCIFSPLTSLGEVDLANDAHRELHAAYEAKLEADFAARKTQEQLLTSKYGGAVSSIRDKMQKHGVAFAVALADGELARLKAADYSGYPEGETIPDALLELREVFEEYHEKVERSLGNKEAMTLYTYDMQLQELGTELRAAGDDAAATSLASFRSNLLNPQEETEATVVVDTPPKPVGGVGGSLRPPGPPTKTAPSTKTASNPPRSRPQISRAVMEKTMMSMPRPMSMDEIKRLSSKLGEKPAIGADGTYPLLLQSMKSGQVTEIKPDIITSWGNVSAEISNGTPYWTIPVHYTTKTIFGEMPAEAKAMVAGGKVVKWIYSGSLELVP